MTAYEYPGLEEKVFREILENGIHLLVVPRKGIRQKTAYLSADFGAIHREFTRNGFTWTVPAGTAHFLEHKLFDMPGGRDISAEFAALGADVNAFTDYDMMAFHFSCTENFDTCLKLLLEFTFTPYFTRETIDRELGIITQEISMASDEPESRVYENLVAAMYPEHPVRDTILGTRESIADITEQVLLDSWHACFGSGRVVLCVVGDVDAEEVAWLARQSLPKALEVVPRRSSWPVNPSSPAAKVCDTMDVAMPMFQLGFKSEPVPKGADSEKRKLTGCLAAEVLFGESSELYLRLYEDGLIDSAFGGAFETMEGMALLTVSGDSRDPEAVREAVLAQAEYFRHNPIQEQEVQRLKRSLLGSRIRDLDSVDATCYHLCASALDGCDYFSFPEAFSAVTCQDIRQFIIETVTPQRCCLSVITPLEQEEPYESR